MSLAESWVTAHATCYGLTAGSAATLYASLRTPPRSPAVAGARAGRPHSVGFAQASRVRGSPHFGPSQGVSRFAFPEPLRAPLQPRVAEDFWDAGEDRIVTEPLFVPRDGAQWDTEDDGYLGEGRVHLGSHAVQHGVHPYVSGGACKSHCHRRGCL